MSLCGVVSLAVAVVSTVSGSATAGHVLPPGQEANLKQQMVAAADALGPAWRLLAVRVAARSVEAEFENKTQESRLRITLRHPSALDPGAPSLGDASLEVSASKGASADVERLLKHFSKRGLVLRWQALAEEPVVSPEPLEAPPHDDAQREANTQNLVDTLRRIQHLRARGDAEQARALVAGLEEASFTAASNRALFAVCLKIVGEDARAEGIATPLLSSDAEAMARIALDPKNAASQILGSQTIDHCQTATVADFLLEMGEAEQGIELLDGTLQASPDCVSARLLMIQHLVAAANGEDALGHLAALPAEVRSTAPSRMIEASALRLVGKLTEAIDLVEEVVRSEGRRQGDMGTLLGMYLREKELQIRISKWRALAAADPEDIVPPFMIGVLLHYGNEFEASTRWLQPLMGRLKGEPRLFVYIAMNAFNLGDKATARRLLDEGARLDVVDPDIYYCRAEITRDSERDLAIDDLHRYLALTEGTPHADAKKQQRVKDMLSAIVACKANGIAECDGPFEHPRRPFIEAIRDYGWWITGAVSALLLWLCLWAWRRLRRSSLSA